MALTSSASGRHAVQPQKKKHPILKLLLVLLVLCALAAGALIFLRPRVTALPPSENPRLVRLDPAWTSQLAACGDKSAMQAYIDQTLADVMAADLAINGLGWNGTTREGAALYRDKTGIRPAAANLPRFFDPMRYLVEQAGKLGITIYLDVPAADLGAADDVLAEQYSLPLLTPQNDPDAPWLAGDLSLINLAAGGNRAALALQGENPDAGIMLGDWTNLQADPSAAILFTAFSDQPLDDPTKIWQDRQQAQTLAVTYPQQDHSKIYETQVFLMGTSDPTQPLYINGQEITRHTEKGSWGVLFPLQDGDNVFTLENGGTVLTHTIEKPIPKKSSKPQPKAEPQPDGSMGAEAIGKKVVVTDAIASALSEPWKSSSIQDTLYQGAAAEVVDVTEYPTGKKLTHAYKLSTGGWVRAATSTIQDLPDAAFTGANIYEDEASRCTVIEFTGSGTPAVYHDWTDNVLTLTLLSAQMTGTLPETARFASAVSQQGKDLTLTLTFAETDPLYGWTVNYFDGVTRLYLKHMPVLAPGSKPLTGLTVLLDPGHGDGDNGAVGSAGLNAPMEKDVNLALALAARTRLQQLGATVTMTRDDDTFPTLGDRVTALNEQHPDLFISVHHNSIELNRDVNEVYGTEAYWFYDEGQRLAQLLVEQLTGSDWADSPHPRQARIERYGYYYVTRSNICPAVLLEAGFMTNPAEYEFSTHPDTLRMEAGNIAAAVYQYFREVTA